MAGVKCKLIFYQSSRWALAFGSNTTHQFPAARVFPHVDTAFVPFEAEATNLPFAQLFRGLPRINFPAWPAFAEALYANTVSPLPVAHTCTSNTAKRIPQRNTVILSVAA